MSEPENARSALVLGLGNLLCGDDGLGVAALAELSRRFHPPPGLDLVDGGTLGLSLLPTLESADEVWILDAVAAEASPGSLVRLEGEAVEPALRERLSPHQIGVADLLDALHWRDTWPKRLRVLGLVPARMGLELGLSEPVARGLDGLIDAVASELAAAGHALVQRPGGGLSEPVDRGGDPAARALGL